MNIHLCELFRSTRIAAPDEGIHRSALVQMKKVESGISSTADVAAWALGRGDREPRV
jgi:hypothetical protein